MPFNNNITPGAPPLLWSDVNDAFTQINENFDIIVATVGGGSGLSPIDFTSLDTAVKPTVDNLRDLGDITHRWKGVFAGEYADSDLFNGLWTGTAQIKGVAGTINLPAGSTVGGNPLTGIGSSLIIDPEKTFFKSIQVDNANSVEATTFGDTLNLISGSGVSMLVSSGADAITISSTGVLSVAAGSGVSVATVSGVATVTNTGVRSLQSMTALPAGRGTGAGINITAGTGDNLRITNTGVIDIVAGSGALAVSTDVVTGIVTITNLSPAQPAFQQIEINADSANRLIADSTAGVFRIVSGQGITLTKDPATDTVTVTVNPVFDLKGSVFADDSTILVDAVAGVLRGNFIGSVFADNSSQIIDGNSFTVYGNIEATTLRTAETKIALGENAGSITQGNNATAVGWLAGYNNQGTAAVAVGREAGEINQGQYAVAVGPGAGYTGQNDYAVAVGYGAGATTQGNAAVAVGDNAGNDTQGNYAVAIGVNAGATTQGTDAVAIGPGAGTTTQGTAAVAIGVYAGQNSQGASAVAIGQLAGQNSQAANSIVINASGVALNGAAAGFYVKPIRSLAAGRIAVYETSGFEVGYTNLEINGSTLSTNDSSGIVVDVLTTFNSDVVIESDLTVAGDLIINGSTTTINSVTLTVDDKNIELGSTASPTDVTADGGGITLKGTTDKTFTYVNSTGLWTANIGIQATEFTGSAATASTASTAASVGYLGLPASAVTTTATLGISDIGKHIYVNTAGQTITIPANSSVAYPIGSALSFIAGPSATTVSIAITTDTMYLAGTGTTGTRTLSAHGMATAVKVAATVWYINGTGLT